MITPFQLQELLKSIGVAEVMVGDPTIAGGMVSIGLTEGEIGFEATETPNNLTTERTGGMPHQATVTLDSAVVTMSIAMSDPALWARLSATGSAGGGYSTPQAVTETSLLLIPQSELGGGLSYTLAAGWTRLAGNGHLGAAGAAAAPKNSVWLWRCYLTRGRVPFRRAEGGKVLTEVRATGMIDITKPEGQMVYTVGAPEAEGIAGIVL